MIESISSNNIFEYEKLSPEEQTKRGILGRLVGVIADSVNPTRNGRKYSLDLWEKVFQNPIMQEKINNRVCFGEACHPVDGREEVDPEKVAICLAEIPKKNSHGQLIGVFDILDTPCGRILKTFADYGANIGVSSRGSGDVIQGYDGSESVDPDTYDCICWDAVFVPAVKAARLKYVTESLDNKTLNQALVESLNEATREERLIMKETLANLNVTIDDDILYHDVDATSKVITEGSKQKRVARVNEFDNGHVIFNMQVMSDEAAEELAKQYSIKDPTDVYYVVYDDIMNPSSDISWFKGRAYKVSNRAALLKNPENFSPIEYVVEKKIDESNEISHVPGGYLHITDNQDGTFDVYFESTWNSSYNWKRHDVSKEELDKLLVDKNLNESDLPDDYADKVASGKIIEKYIDLTEPSSQYDLDKYLSNGWSIKHQGMTLVILYKEFTNESLNEDINTISDVDRDELINTQETGLHIEESGDMAVEDSEANVVSELQEALKENDNLARTVTSLQEKLSVGYTKEAELQALVDKYTNVIRNLTENAKKVAPLKAKVDVLTEKVENLTSQLSSKDTNIKSLQENVKSQNSGVNVLQEQLDVKEAEVEKLQHSIEMLNEQFGERESSLNQKFEDLKNEYQIKEQSYVKKLNSSTKLVEKYKQVASNAVNTYIESQARLLGVSSNEVKNRLPENYSIKDINTVCENMRSYKLNISKLPFRTNLQENVTLKATASKKDPLASVNKYDVVDDFDLKLANML